MKRSCVALLIIGTLMLTGCNIGCWFVPCDPPIDVGVVVRDPGGAPLSGVHVEVNGFDGETDENGRVEAGGVTHANVIFVIAQKAGYKKYVDQRRYGFYVVEITLEPDASPRPSSAKWTVQPPLT